MTNQKCGNCVHSRIVKQDLTQRICRGAPPQIVIMPVPGGVQQQHHWPVVDAGDEGCGLYKMKLAIDTTEGNA